MLHFEFRILVILLLTISMYSQFNLFCKSVRTQYLMYLLPSDKIYLNSINM